MTLRTRLTIMVATAVAGAVLAGAWLAYDSTRRELHAETDAFLVSRLAGFARELRGGVRGDPDASRLFERLGGAGGAGPRPLVDFDVVAQVIDAHGRVVASVPGQPTLPGSGAGVHPVAPGGHALSNVDVDGVTYRMLTHQLPGGRRVQLARSLAETDLVLAGLRNRLGVIAIVGTLLAGVGAWLLARRATEPVEALTDACERVAATQDLATPVPGPATGELGRLAASFNTMLGALGASRRQQQRLVADAGHELRTPLTAIRTNVDFLERASTLPDAERRSVLAETRLELDEISNLVEELAELATDSRGDEPVERVDLADLVEDVAARFRRRTGRTVTVDAAGAGALSGRRAQLDRAVSNLVDNALKFSPPATALDVTVRGSRLEVSDRGPGIAPVDRPRVFDRFYRSAEARTLPGSGLGLAIVAQIVEQHGGTVTMADREGGGLTARVDLPPTP